MSRTVNRHARTGAASLACAWVLWAAVIAHSAPPAALGSGDTVVAEGDEEALSRLRAQVDSGELDKQARMSAIASILASGSMEDLYRYGLDTRCFTEAGDYHAEEHAEVLQRVVEVAQVRQLQPGVEATTTIAGLIRKDHPKVRANAIRLAGLWSLEQGSIKQAIVAAATSKTDSTELRAAAIASLAAIELQSAALHACDLYEDPDVEVSDITATLLAFLNQDRGGKTLASAIEASQLKPASAKQLLRGLFATGRSDPALIEAISQVIGAESVAPEYDEAYVDGLVTDARRHGDAKRGAILFRGLACAACHQVAGAGGTLGPDLTTIGKTLPAQRIVEELLWPERQVKEGYAVLFVLTTSGRIHTGHQLKTEAGQTSGDLVLQDLASDKLTTIKQEEILEKRTFGSSMPSGLTAILTRAELLDLIQYLCELGKSP